MNKEELQIRIKELEKELRSVKANVIRDLKKNHPKGFCYICGKSKRATIHHLSNGKTIPLCRDCHDEVERAKVYINSMKSRKSAYQKGFTDGVINGK